VSRPSVVGVTEKKKWEQRIGKCKVLYSINTQSAQKLGLFLCHHTNASF
jgi:hypothetical protein